jgi:alpha-1,6-mannosyltransferase
MRHTAVRQGWFALDRTAKVLIVALVTGALHAVLYASQRRLYDHLTRRPALLAWALATAGLFLTYAWVVNRCRQPMPTREFLAVVMLTPLVIQLCWLFTVPVLSVDLYSYVADSLSAQAGLNPYVHAPREWGSTPFGAELERYGWRPTHGVAPYGPLWMLFMAALGSANLELPHAVLIVKAVLIACNAACAVLIAGILREINPDAQLLGAAAFWWNPIGLEIAAEGHNDAAMTMTVLLGLWLTLRRRHTGGALSLTCAVLIKYVPAILVPAFLVYRWRAQPRGRLSGIALWGLLSALLCVLLFAPFWAGWQTFAGVFASLEREFMPGTSGVLFAVLSKIAGPGPAELITMLLLGGISVVAVLVLSPRAIDGSRLVAACATLCLVYVLVASPRFWPWYVILPVALLCATGTREAVLLVAVLTFCARLIAPLSLIYRVNAIDWPTAVWISTVVGVWIPAVWWIFSSPPVAARSSRVTAEARAHDEPGPA